MLVAIANVVLNILCVGLLVAILFILAGLAQNQATIHAAIIAQQRPQRKAPAKKV